MTDTMAEQSAVAERTWSFEPALARALITIYLFFALFGTSLPFQERAVSAEEIVSSNRVNQFIYTLLYLMAAASLLGRGAAAMRLVKRERLLWLFIAWCGATILWSYEPMVSLKRWLQLAGDYLIFVSVLVHAESDESLLRTLKTILLLYTIASLASVLAVPDAVHENGVWRGLAPHKNILGQTALIGMIVWSYAALGARSVGRRGGAVLLWLLSALLLAGSRSATSALTYLMLAGLLALHWVELRVMRPKIGPRYSRLIIGFSLIAVLALVLAQIEIFELLLGLVGRDMTLTERVDLWASVFDETRKHWLFGCGYGGYWVTTSPLMETIYEEFVWLPNQAHNGYLDILNETGVVGLGLLLGFVLFYFKRLQALPGSFFWKWVFFAVLILNLTESMFIRVHEATSALFFLSYLAAFGAEGKSEKRIR